MTSEDRQRVRDKVLATLREHGEPAPIREIQDGAGEDAGAPVVNAIWELENLGEVKVSSDLRVSLY